ncbi:MAG: hypothetical protein ABIZ50_02400 [Solirubrobacterales bacterium]
MTLTKPMPTSERKPRTIDVPLEQLPPIDEHYIEIEAPAEVAWAALFPAIEAAFATPFARRFSQRVGALETEARGDLHHPGGTLPGFTVSRAIAPVMLAMSGEHRYAKYAIVFRIDLLPGQRTCVRLETRAKFPPGKGRLYRAAVIGTRGHVVIVNRLLRSIKRRAERSANGR